MSEPPILRPPKPPTAAERVGTLLRREREAAKLSQGKLAERLGIHQATLARWETGRSAPTLAQADQTLAHFGIRLRLDVEPMPDPNRAWDREVLRLASLTPAERLAQTSSGLARLMETARDEGVSGAVDGQTAAWLQGVPGPPRWMEIVTTTDQVHAWVTLKWTVQGGVDSNREQLRLTKEQIAEQFSRDGRGLLRSVYGLISLRVEPELPETTRLCLR